jgi:uncharacterized OB-fold protein
MSIPQNWRIRQQRYTLMGEVCQNCHSPIFPPREVCPLCGAPSHVQLTFIDYRAVWLALRPSEVHQEATLVPVKHGQTA